MNSPGSQTQEDLVLLDAVDENSASELEFEAAGNESVSRDEVHFFL